jgi:hypothetical protein
MSTNFKKMATDNPEKYPSRMGQPWDDEEVVKLLTSIQKKKSVQEIAVEHGRTEGGITAELRKLAADYHYNDKRSMEEIQKYTGLSQVVIERAIAKRENKMEGKEEKKAKKNITDVSVIAHMAEETEMQQVISLLKDIQSKLSSLLDKVA